MERLNFNIEIHTLEVGRDGTGEDGGENRNNKKRDIETKLRDIILFLTCQSTKI